MDYLRKRKEDNSGHNKGSLLRLKWCGGAWAHEMSQMKSEVILQMERSGSGSLLKDVFPFILDSSICPTSA